MPETQIIDPRTEGVYCSKSEYPSGSGNYSVRIDRVNGDGSVNTIECTMDEANVIRRVLQVWFIDSLTRA